MGLKRNLIAAVLAFGASAAGVQLLRVGSTPSTAAAASSRVVVAGTSYASLLGDLDRRIDGLYARVQDRPDDWLTRMHLGTVLLERSGLTNQPDDFARVQQLLDEAFAIAPEGSGPMMLAARFNVSIHRLAIAESYLETMARRPIQKRNEQVAAQVLRSQIAMQRGQYDVALAGLTAAAAAEPEVANVELALYHAKTGDVAQAEALLEDALASTTAKDPRRRAWLRMQLGMIAMDRGAPLVALEHLQSADAELPGWWLVQEHIAEAHDRLGEHGKSIAILEALVAESGMPQHLDALATSYQHAGQQAKADALIARSAAAWDEQLARFPESAMGHGLLHHLQFGTPERALELALANYANRPGGDAQVLLARAYLRAGRAADALEVVTRTLATPYRTASVHDVAAQAYAALGNTTAAQAQLELRAAINPTYQGQEHSH